MSDNPRNYMQLEEIKVNLDKIIKLLEYQNDVKITSSNKKYMFTCDPVYEIEKLSEE